MGSGTQANVFWHLAEVERARAARCRHAFALALADLQGLKEANYRLGRPAGDELLRAAVEAMKEHLYETDTVSRLGGGVRSAALGERWHAATRSVRTTSLVRIGNWEAGNGCYCFLRTSYAANAIARCSSGIVTSRR